MFIYFRDRSSSSPVIKTNPMIRVERTRYRLHIFNIILYTPRTTTATTTKTPADNSFFLILFKVSLD